MEFSEFVRKPFTVEATEVTTENIAEVAELIGALKEKENGTPYIAVDRRLVPNLYRVYPGFWLTRMGDNIRCYSKRVFKQQFVANNAEIQTWVDYMNAEHEAEPTLHVVEAVEAAVEGDESYLEPAEAVEAVEADYAEAVEPVDA